MVAFDLAAARRAAEGGALESWVHEYLLGPGRNAEFSRGLHLEPRRWHGPLDVPLASLQRSCGPEPDMPFREPRENWERAVTFLASQAAPIEAFPPLLVRYEKGQLVISDGNHRHAAFAQRGWHSCWIIIWYPNDAEFAHHEARGFGIGAARLPADNDVGEFLRPYGISPKRSHVLHRDADAVVLKVETNRGLVVLKVKREAERPIVEAETTRRLHAAGLPVEPLIGSGALPTPHIVRAWVPGAPLSSQSPRSAQREAGALLRRIHDLGGGPPYGGNHAWDEWMHGWMNHALRWWRDSGHGDQSRVDAAWAWFRNIRPLLASRGHHFMLFDGRPEHFLVDEGPIRGIVDLETARSGDAGMDLGVMAVTDPGLLKEVLVGYDAEPAEAAVLRELVPYYVFLRRLAAAEWNLGRGNAEISAAVLSLLKTTEIPA